MGDRHLDYFINYSDNRNYIPIIILILMINNLVVNRKFCLAHSRKP